MFFRLSWSCFRVSTVLGVGRGMNDFVEIVFMDFRVNNLFRAAQRKDEIIKLLGASLSQLVFDFYGGLVEEVDHADSAKNVASKEWAETASLAAKTDRRLTLIGHGYTIHI